MNVFYGVVGVVIEFAAEIGQNSRSCGWHISILDMNGILNQR